jgi:hypothetical protein
MGAAFGAVIAQTAVANLVVFIAPTVWALVGPALFKDNADWLDSSSPSAESPNANCMGRCPRR